jgi:sulfoxide reductase catalytic subunit YedY
MLYDMRKVENMKIKRSTSHMNIQRALIMLVVGTLLCAPMILTGETVQTHPSDSDNVIASADRDTPSAGTGTEEGMSEDQYEATKNLHETGIARTVNVFSWRLDVEGDKVGKPLSLSYRELNNMDMVKKEVTLVCPGFFTDVAMWEGVPLVDVLEMAQVEDDYEQVIVTGLDSYRSVLDKEEMENHLIFLALKVNGVTLPKEHGYPIRLVAEDITGGKWVKWIDSIEVK